MSRPEHDRDHPVHVVLRSNPAVGDLRRAALADAIVTAIRESKASPTGMRVLHYSIQSNHLHLIVEASDRDVLARGMQGLSIRMARAINWAIRGREGRVFTDRYHSHALTTPYEMRHGIAYVLLNHRIHDAGSRGIDTLSSGRWFGGWSDRDADTDESPVSEPKTWLASKGWRKQGLISLREKPRADGDLATLAHFDHD